MQHTNDASASEENKAHGVIIDGKHIAADMILQTRARAERLGTPPHIIAMVPQETPATRSYLKIKEARARDAGCTFATRAFSGSVDEVHAASEHADAIVIQLPVRDDMDMKSICDAIPLLKDADVLSTAARDAFMRSEEGALLPPVVGAVKAVLEQGGVDPRGRTAVVVGQGFLVGAPVATWLAQQGAEVVVVTEEQGDLAGVLSRADIIVLGAGSPGLVTPELIPEGVVLIDAGTSELGGKIVGDADPRCAAKCSLFTPVPGGIGPIAVACLFQNVLALAQKKMPTPPKESVGT